MSSSYAPGALIGPYHVISVLQGYDVGGIAGIYLARLPAGHPGQSPVVIKVLPNMAKQDVLKGEASAFRPFEHPNLLRLLPIPQPANANDPTARYRARVDPANPESPLYIVLEYLPGGSLRQLLAQCGRLSPAAAVEVTLQACEGLAHMHQQQVLHLDVKPENILLRQRLSRWSAERPQVVIADFGTAQARYRRRTTPTYATRAYLAPERAEGAPPDQRQDVFALGIVLYEMLTGQRPYGDDAPAASVLDTRNYPSALNRLVAPDLDTVVLRAIERDPYNRYASIGELQIALKRLDIDQPGRIKRPIMSGAAAYALAASVAILLLVLLAAQLLGAAFDTGISPQPTAMATALATSMPTVALYPIMIATATRAAEATTIPMSTSAPAPTSTPAPSITSSP